MPTPPAVDWKALDPYVLALLLETVRGHLAAHPADHVYGAAFHNFYAETGGVIAWPQLAIGTEQDLRTITDGSGLSADDLRWSPADWTAQVDPTEADDGWAARIEAYARSRDDARWERTYERFLRAFPKAARRARGALVADGAVPKDFVAVAMDEEWDLVPRSLTAAQLRRHFPELDEEAAALARLDALPEAERAAALGAILDDPVPGPVSVEVATTLLTGLGRDAVRVAAERLPHARDRWRWAKLLADIGIPEPGALAALFAVVRDRRAPETGRSWAADALARLGRLDLVLAERDRISREVLRGALAAPFTSFRDRAVRHRALDYSELERVLLADPDLAAEMLDELHPGRGFCALRPDEVETARAALDSPVEVIRRHAALVLAGSPPSVRGRSPVAR